MRARASSTRSRAGRIGVFLLDAGACAAMLEGAAKHAAAATEPASNLRRLRRGGELAISCPHPAQRALARRGVCRGDLLAQKWDRFEIGRLRNGLEVGVDIDQLLIGEHLGRVGRHVAARRPHPGLQGRPGQRNGIGDARSFPSALALMAMALPAADALEIRLAFRGVALRRGLRRKRRRASETGCCKGDRGQDRGEMLLLHGGPQRGWQTTSIKTGSPIFTASMPRLMAPPSSLGSVIGPMPTWPKASASLA